MLEESGYARIASGRWTLLADVGPVGPDEQAGHAHADTLSFELAFGRRRVVVDPGTSTYEAGPQRERERGTGLHNTVCVDGADSSEVWGRFRTARRACAKVLRATTDPDGCELVAAHDGYTRLRSPVVHTRRWAVRPARVDIVDFLEGSGEHALELGLLLAPDVKVSAPSDGGILATLGADVLRIQMPTGLEAGSSRPAGRPRSGASSRRRVSSRAAGIACRRLCDAR